MALKTKSKAAGPAAAGKASAGSQTSPRPFARPRPAGRPCRLQTGRSGEGGDDRPRDGRAPFAGHQRHRYPHRTGHRGQRPAGVGDHRRQRQHAVPVRFRARRNHRQRRRTDAGHSSGGARPARQVGCRRNFGRGRQARCGCRTRQRHPGACRQAVAGPGRRAEGPARQGARPGAGGGQGLEADAGPSRPRDLRFPLCAGAARQGGGHGSDRLPRMAARRQFHLPRHARIPLFGRRGQRHARPQRPARARHPVGSRCAGAAPRQRGGDDDARNPRLPAWTRSADRHQGQRQVESSTGASISTMSASRPTARKAR